MEPPDVICPVDRPPGIRQIIIRWMTPSRQPIFSDLNPPKPRPMQFITPSRVLLLRHAETAAPDRFHGAESDIGLGARGHEQARDIASKLALQSPDALYCSPMLRARQTAEPIALACGLKAVVVNELHERRMGPLSGMSLAEGWDAYISAMDRWKSGDLEAAHEGGESYAQIRDRVVPAFVGLARRHPGETIVVVAHGVVIRVLLTALLEGKGPADFEGFGIDFVAVNDLRFDGGVWRAETLNGLPAGMK
jgi:probable phosphoglycerate mutase